MQRTSVKGSARAQIGQIGAGCAMAAGLFLRDLYLNHHLDGFDYALMALFVAALCVGAVNLFVPPALELDDGGMTWRSWRSKTTYRWEDLDRFLLGRRMPGGRQTIAFDFLPDSARAGEARSGLNRALSGYDRSMVNVWDMPSEDLVELLNSRLAEFRAEKPAGEAEVAFDPLAALHRRGSDSR